MAIVTHTITAGSTLNVSKADGFTYVAVLVDSASTASATILGLGRFADGTTSTATSIPAGTSLQILREGFEDIIFTITAPAGCTVYFTGLN